ncbi:novel immune-type receptor 1c [Danio aesculapii]|uniref:novel immune-type receptor 1c n=1 Tax=Danio aesculapii TaxID=1142201 RepID=UPI0024C03A04|nr:novel immune-type receptor 1c [Danio aesculapii]
MGNSKHKDHFGGRLIMRYYSILLLSPTIFCSTGFDVVQEENVKIVEAGENVNFTCIFPGHVSSTKAWFKQTTVGKYLQIVSLAFQQQLKWNPNFEKTNRFNVAKVNDYFNLTILKTKPSDSATYYCAVSAYQTIGMGSATRLLVKDAAADRKTTLHQSLIDTVDPGDSVNLQCSIFTESCAENHSVYWFKQSSGHPERVLYSKGERNGPCKNRTVRTETQTQSCIYSLHKNNISHSDSGIYYCAVDECGEILFGRGTQLNIRENYDFNPALYALGISNFIFLVLVVFLGIKLCRSQIKTSVVQTTQDEDSLNYASISFSQKPLNTRRARAKFTQDHSLYAQVRSHQ